jgi:hypothetical protein
MLDNRQTQAGSGDFLITFNLGTIESFGDARNINSRDPFTKILNIQA